MSQSAKQDGYPYHSSPSNQYNLYRDGKVCMTAATENEVWSYLHRFTSASVGWALKNEGWSIVPVEEVQP